LEGNRKDGLGRKSPWGEHCAKVKAVVKTGGLGSPWIKSLGERGKRGGGDKILVNTWVFLLVGEEEWTGLNFYVKSSSREKIGPGLGRVKSGSKFSG